MNFEDRINYFKYELDLIANDNIRNFVKTCINAAPDYVFEDCPSSSSGKYHPIEELGADGTLLHTRKVFAVAYEFSRALNCEYNRDAIISAAILHDMAKQGLEKAGHTVKDHPQIMAQLIKEIYEMSFIGVIDTNSFNIIYNAVAYHYGPWTEKIYLKDMTKYSMEELCVYLADYIVSKRFVEITLAKRS